MKALQIKVRLLFCLVGHLALLLILALYLQSSLLSVTRFTPLANAREAQMESLSILLTHVQGMMLEMRTYHKTLDPKDLADFSQRRDNIKENINSLKLLPLQASPSEKNRQELILQWLREVADVILPQDSTTPASLSQDRWDHLNEINQDLIDRLTETTAQVKEEVKLALDGLQEEEASEAGDRVKLMWVLVGGVTFFTILIQLAVSNSIINPIQKLGITVKKLQQGDYSSRSNLRTGDEIQSLGNAFNSMAESIQKNQQELEEINASLEERVSEKTRELEEKNLKLKEASRQKDEFLATLSHELRTPLTPVLSCAFLLGNDGHLNPDDQKNVRVIERNARALSRMIDELLDLSATMNQKLILTRESVEVNDWCRSVVEGMRPAWEKKDISLFFIPADHPIDLNIDATRLAQVVTNLVTNAIKFTENQGQIRVGILELKDQVQIYVQDTGIGLEKKELEHVFEMFHQARTAKTMGIGGLGVGLSVAKALAELHGGGLVVESEGLGKGCRFTVWLPRQIDNLQADEMRLAKTLHIRQSGPIPLQLPEMDRLILKGKKILLVDDAVDTLEAMERIFSRRGCQVFSASNAETGMELAFKELPDVILSDIGLPRLSGVEMVRKIRENPHFGTTITIALSGLGREQDANEALAAGFDAYLVKPVEIAILEKTLVEAFKNHKSRC